LPVPAPEQLLILHSQEPEEGHTSNEGMDSSFSYPLYRDLNAATPRIFDGILAFKGIDASLAGRDATETVHGYLVSGNFFRVLEVTPWRGRTISPSDDETVGANPVVVLSHALWMRAYGGDSGILNHTILLNKHPYVVIGIAPPQFYGIDVSARADVFVPMSMKEDVYPDQHQLTDRLDHWCNLIARLKPGVDAAQATAALNALYPPLRDQDLAYMKSPSAEFRQKFSRKTIPTAPGGKGYAGIRDGLSNPLKILMGMVGVVLLITVVNVANLLVARGVARQREMAIRLSVGAGKAALIRQLMIESLLLACIGGGLGIAIAYGCTSPLLNLLSFDLSSASISARPDWRVLLFAAGATIAAGIGFGLLPAWQSSRMGTLGHPVTRRYYGEGSSRFKSPCRWSW
jgi:predicted permease